MKPVIPTIDADSRILDEFNLNSWKYDLPEDRIAQVPSPSRDGSRLMVLRRDGGGLEHKRFSEIIDYLNPEDCLVVNDTKVIPARLFAQKASGGQVELLVLSHSGAQFSAMYRTHRGLKGLARLELIDRRDQPTGAVAEIIGVEEGGICHGVVRDSSGGEIAVRDAMTDFGRIPLPPYIRRKDAGLHNFDLQRYQTVYAGPEGAVAAPTAGLHFTPAIIEEIERKGLEVFRLTLHVGPGTFKPITTADIRHHDVGTETFEVSSATADGINRRRKEGGRVVAVGTTVVRTLETVGIGGDVVAGRGTTRLFITPGYQFKIVSSLVTNFHLPGSSLIVLVAAMVGQERILSTYRTAVESGYRFYSYGDAMLII